MMEPIQENLPKRRFFRLEPWPTAIVLFFMVVFVVNILFVRLSLNSWTGLVTEGAYDKGLAYNKVIQAREAQETLGWRVTLDDAALRVGSESRLRLAIVDKQGAPVIGARVNGRLVRPVQQGYDRDFIMQEAQPGAYEVGLSIPMPGIWELQVSVDKAERVYRLTRRVQVSASALGG
ncbi:MAG: FixH family protein [Magnetococcus sp. YQC-9]